MRKLLKIIMVCLLMAYASEIVAPVPALAVYVKGYYRKDGTYVAPHTRKRPRKHRRRRSAEFAPVVQMIERR